MVHDGARADRAVVRRTRTEEHTGRPKWLPLLVCALLVPLLLALLTLVFSGHSIESKLTAASQEALRDAGLGAVGVSFNGRDGVLTGVPKGHEAKARDVVAAVNGVRVADVRRADGQLDMKLDRDTLALSGTVPDRATRAAAIAQAEQQATGRQVVTRDLVVKDGALLPGNATAVGPLVSAMAPDEAGRRQLSWDADGVRLSGDIPSDDALQKAADRVAAALPGIAVDNGIKSREAAQAEIDKYLAANPIRFEAHSSALTPASRQVVEHVAGLLADFPDAVLSVEGHVDPSKTKRKASSAYQKRLSTDRAAAVKDALVEQGIDADLIAATGLGQDGPNPGRRVDITIQ